MSIITPQDIQRYLPFPLADEVAKAIVSRQLAYQELSGAEYVRYLHEYVKVLAMDLSRAGSHRAAEWESGWQENVDDFRAASHADALIPKYHTKYDIARLHGRIIRTFDKKFDYYLHTFFVDAVLHHYCKDVPALYDFGCGTGYHLFRLAQSSLRAKQFVGLDWAMSSQQAIADAAKTLNMSNISAEHFDYFSPRLDLPLTGAGVYTVASLEQIGDQYAPFIEMLIAKKPAICIHFEPIAELLAEDTILDTLTKAYFAKRNYLQGFYSYLQKLAAEKKIDIIDARRFRYGSKFIEGHSLVIWKPR